MTATNVTTFVDKISSSFEFHLNIVAAGFVVGIFFSFFICIYIIHSRDIEQKGVIILLLSGGVSAAAASRKKSNVVTFVVDF